MSFLSNLRNAFVLTNQVSDVFTTIVRGKARKAVGSCRLQRQGERRIPKYRGMKKTHGDHVERGMVLYTQFQLRFHPGLNVVFGHNGTLSALEPGKVAITLEKVDPKWGHWWIDRNYSGFKDAPIYKKYYHVIPEKQENKFVLVDKI